VGDAGERGKDKRQDEGKLHGRTERVSR